MEIFVYLLCLKQKDDRTESIDRYETGSQWDNKIVNAATWVLGCHYDQLMMPPHVISIFIGAVFTVLRSNNI